MSTTDSPAVDTGSTGTLAPEPASSTNTTSVPLDSVGRDVLEERCRVLEQAVRRQPNVKPETLAAQRPGGMDNSDTSAMGWLAYHTWLTRMHASGPGQPTASRARWDAQAIADLRAALAAEPIHLTLDGGREVAVHPKSEYALNRIVLLSLATEFVTVRKMALLEAPDTADRLDVLKKAIDAEARLQWEFVAIVTHPGPGLPWTDDSQWEHDSPAWIREEVTPFDVVQLVQAHEEVNVKRVHAISERTRHLVQGNSASAPLAAFLGTMSAELAVQPEELTRKWSLGAIFASALAKFEAHDAAQKKAESERAAAGQ